MRIYNGKEWETGLSDTRDQSKIHLKIRKKLIQEYCHSKSPQSKGQVDLENLSLKWNTLAIIDLLIENKHGCEMSVAM